MATLAVVLTHVAPEALERCLRAIDAQTTPPDRVLVVDNASRVPAEAGTVRVPVDVQREPVNTGPAGGHAAGLTRFLASGFDVAWVMDDDCVPEPECLERLLARLRAEPGGGIVFPWWLDAATGEGHFRTAWCGFVVDRVTVERLGVPRADFVWWAEDTEYLQWRPHRHGVRVEEDAAARVLHDRVRWVGEKPAWKYYYEVRNTVFFRLYVQRKPYRRFKWLARSLPKLLGQIVLREDHKMAKLAAYGRGLFDGLTGRLGLRMELG
jgi:GT2 family glycosyltransferase